MFFKCLISILTKNRNNMEDRTLELIEFTLIILIMTLIISSILILNQIN